MGNRSEAVAFLYFPSTSWYIRCFRFSGRQIAFLTSTHVSQCSFWYIWVPYPRNHGYCHRNFNSISSKSRVMRYFRFSLTSHSVRFAMFAILILENMGIAVGILILFQLPAKICGSSGLSAAIFNLRLPVCREAHIHSARWGPCSSKSLDTRSVDFCTILVFYSSLKLYQTCHSSWK